jgi:hypothetical protein
MLALGAVIYNAHANTDKTEVVLSRKEACRVAYSQNSELHPNHPRQSIIDIYVSNYNTLCND